MRQVILKLLLVFVFAVPAIKANGQASTCNGSFGDPVINEDFGSGGNPGGPLSPGITNMLYTTLSCPEDGYYTIAHSLAGADNCHPYTWYNVPTDHTGNPNGYMMIVNASYQPSVFFRQSANGLCPNTTYEFSAYILNLCIPSFITAAYSQPNITFSIQTTTGKVLDTVTTGPLAVFGYSQGAQWVKYPCYFTTPANVADVVVVMTNNAPGGNGNDFILDDIQFRACGPIIQEGFSSVPGPVSQSLCQGGSGDFVLKTQVFSNGKPQFQWQVSNSHSPWEDIPGETRDFINVQFKNASPSVYQYRMGVSNGSVITDVSCRVYSNPLTIYVNPTPVVPAIPTQTVCEGYPLQLTATGGGTYTWTGPGIPPTTGNPLVDNNVTMANAGVYTVVAVSDSGCTAAPVQTTVKVIPKVVAAVQNTSSEICAGESTQLSASGGLYYKWTPATGLDNDSIPNPIATPLQTTTYTVHVGNGGCTDSSKMVTVTVDQVPVANAGNEIILFEGQSAKLQGAVKGDNITGYNWSPSTFLSDPTLLTPVTTPTDNITYTLTATSKSCGSSSSSVYVRVYKKVTIPNTFTPNNDGINDYWDIKALDTYPQSTTLVYDRYGKQVYQSTGYPRPWDGTYSGKMLPTGTYYYVIDLKIGTPKIAGWVLLLK
jgi:gliding motility-associated-like protein